MSDIFCSLGQCLKTTTAIVLLLPPSWVSNFTRNRNSVARCFLENTANQTVSGFHHLHGTVLEITEGTICYEVTDLHGNHGKCAEMALHLYFPEYFCHFICLRLYGLLVCW